ncbi:hypothetical protein J6590_088778 [Homalodisca vitripennis]|nr:hypothetical protein J6590_088778 [Homalodisca vitripennis]
MITPECCTTLCRRFCNDHTPVLHYTMPQVLPWSHPSVALHYVAGFAMITPKCCTTLSAGFAMITPTCSTITPPEVALHHSQGKDTAFRGGRCLGRFRPRREWIYRDMKIVTSISLI